MKVSIIIPTYNVETYITECLESVAHQTYKDEMECLIVDDCGTDNSIAVAEQFIHSYHGDIIFKIIHHEHNRGLSAARNTGVEAATGDYVYFLDSDDAIVPETIEIMMNVTIVHPQVEMVQGGVISTNGQVLEDFETRDIPEYTDNAALIAESIFFRLPVTSWNRLLKRKFLIKEKIMFREGIIHEDVPYCYQLALKCHQMGLIRKNTYRFRLLREGSITNTPQEKRAFQSRVVIMNDCLDVFLTLQKETEQIRKYAILYLWKKWLVYMNIQTYEVLNCYKDDVVMISNRLTDYTPYPWKLLAASYKILPLTIRHKNVFIKLFEICTKR